MSRRIHVRPGKTQSKIGFVVGLLFCIFGLFVAVPTFGLFGIIWTAMAGMIAFVNYKNGFTDEKIDSQVIEIDDEGRNATTRSYTGFETYSYDMEGDASTDDDVEARLKKLQSLYDQSLITYEEYEQKRKEILEDL